MGYLKQSQCNGYLLHYFAAPMAVARADSECWAATVHCITQIGVPDAPLAHAVPREMVGHSEHEAVRSLRHAFARWALAQPALDAPP